MPEPGAQRGIVLCGIAGECGDHTNGRFVIEPHSRPSLWVLLAIADDELEVTSQAGWISRTVDARPERIRDDLRRPLPSRRNLRTKIAGNTVGNETAFEPGPLAEVSGDQRGSR
jgi:hypothetical protein